MKYKTSDENSMKLFFEGFSRWCAEILVRVGHINWRYRTTDYLEGMQRIKGKSSRALFWAIYSHFYRCRLAKLPCNLFRSRFVKRNLYVTYFL